MTGASSKADSFKFQQGIFGACDRDTLQLLLIVEAGSIEEAETYVDAVAPLLGVKRGSELVVVALDAIPTGIPTFLRAFFEAGNIGVKRGDVAPGSSTLQ
ncbi:hypothetical protein [Polaromonas sp. C04]|uniref:hypothetical protein n=1 Tax=Polaromonas sp. C04 TaxID=1945857 RepID=UPI0009852468|nr:hypothetical protein [Polaromonas sp. C04]OOG58072.1 hypothetical protein B0E49_04385 [Polaromonas sp. C04]